MENSTTKRPFHARNSQDRTGRTEAAVLAVTKSVWLLRHAVGLWVARVDHTRARHPPPHPARRRRPNGCRRRVARRR